MGLFDFFRKKDDVSKEVKELEAIHKAGLHTVEEIRDEILRETAVPCMKLELTDEKPGLFDSKVGGIGYVPRDEQIPRDSEGHELRLLAQLDCGQITLEDFPHEGLLQFWILNDDAYGLNFDDGAKQDTFRVLYWRTVDRTVTEEEVQAKMSSDTSDDDCYFPVQGCYKLRLEKGMDTISDGDYRFEECITKLVQQRYPAEADDLLDDPYDFADDEGLNGFGHKIGGYPGFTQCDPRDDSDASPYDVLLFQLDSDYDEEEKVMWGDSGICNFFINREKLKHCDFSDVLYNWDCC